MKFTVSIFISLILCFTGVKAQVKKDTVGSPNQSEKKSNLSPSIENKFNPKSSFKLLKDDFTLPYDLRKYSAIMSLDIPDKKEPTKEEISSGLTEDEIDSFRNNKNSTMRMLAEFYGEDLVNIKKLMDSIGLTKDQIVGVLMVLKFVFGQALIK